MQTECFVEVNGHRVDEVTSFDYSDDVMAVSEDAHFTVENKKHKFRDLLRIGEVVEFYLSNRYVNGGVPTLKHKGRITARNPRFTKAEGATISVTSSDLGWHLQRSDAPLWLRLKNKTYADLVDPAQSKFYDASWGFLGVRFDGEIRRKLKLGVTLVAQDAQKVLDPVHVIQIEPGEKAADKFLEYCRRLNLLVNVSPDGYLCCFRPNDRQPPSYRLRLLDDGAENNVLSAEVMETAESRYTECVCGDMFQNGYAQKAAEWAYKRGMFDAWSATYEVGEHHHGSLWWAADSIVDVADDENGVYGNFYVQAVRQRGSKGEADVTQVIVRFPGLLSAAFGEIPTPTFKAISVTGTPKEGT